MRRKVFHATVKNKSPLDNKVRLFPHGVLNNVLHNNSPEERIVLPASEPWLTAAGAL